jgi:hypothetical protein
MGMIDDKPVASCFSGMDVISRRYWTGRFSSASTTDTSLSAATVLARKMPARLTYLGTRGMARALIAGARRRGNESIVFRERGVATTGQPPSMTTGTPSTLQK